MKHVKFFIPLLVSQMIVMSLAAPRSLFPDETEVTSPDNSLSSAVAQFDQIIESSSTGNLNSLDSNTRYNQERIEQLKAQLQAKRKYLQTLPEVASRQFEAMMAQYPDADQERKDRIAHEIHTQFKDIENSTRQEIADLENQLALSGHRVGEARMQKQMIEISQSIADGRDSLREGTEPEKKPQRPHRDAFEYMQSLSQQRILSCVQALTVIQVRPFDAEYTASFVGK